MHRIRRYLSFANIVSLIALFVALGGSSYAVYRIKGSQIADRSIGERKLKLNTLGRKSVAEYSLGKVRNAKRADMVGNLRASQLKVRCPRQAYELAGTCLELQRRPAVPFRVANLDCAREGKRLPTYGELASLLSGGEFGEPSGGELTADTFLDGSGALRAVTVTSSAGTAASVGNDFAGARPYRCVSYPRN